MITRPTVLVLGAGSSATYGFPTGQELFWNLIRLGQRDEKPGGGHYFYSNAADFLRWQELATPEELHDFTAALRFSGVRSVDRFLEARPDLRHIGKCVMAAELIQHEYLDSLFNGGRSGQGDWYRYLWEQIDSTPDGFRKNRLTVVTFNYDRSLEAFLHHSMMHLYRRSESEAWEIVSELPIVHVHGQLASYDFTAAEGRPYSREASRQSIERAAAGIEIVSEAQNDGAGFARARAAIAEAERVVFLGFSYHRNSLRRLGFPSVGGTGRKAALGSTLGMTEAEVLALSQFMRPVNFVPDPQHLPVESYLRSLAPLGDG